jgi:hypothetical protein
MKSTITRYAFYATGLLWVLALLNWFLVAKPFGYVASEVAGYLSMVVALSMVFFAIRHYRIHYGAGLVTFGRGFRIGMLITLLTSALFFVYSVIYFRIFGDEFRQWADEFFSTSMTPEEYQNYLDKVVQLGDLYTNIWFQGMVMFFTVFLIGLIITLISATILRRHQT